MRRVVIAPVKAGWSHNVGNTGNISKSNDGTSFDPRCFREVERSVHLPALERRRPILVADCGDIETECGHRQLKAIPGEESHD